MSKKLTAEDFADVPWGGRAIPPEGSVYVAAVRIPWKVCDTAPWVIHPEEGAPASRSDVSMADAGWTLPTPDAPTDPWDAVPDMLQDMWDAGEERDAEEGELYVHRRKDGSLEPGMVLSSADEAIPGYRLRPRPRPSWQDAEVVEASTDGDSSRRYFFQSVPGVWRDTRDGMNYLPSSLIDPVPMTVQKKEER